MEESKVTYLKLKETEIRILLVKKITILKFYFLIYTFLKIIFKLFSGAEWGNFAGKYLFLTQIKTKWCNCHSCDILMLSILRN